MFQMNLCLFFSLMPHSHLMLKSVWNENQGGIILGGTQWMSNGQIALNVKCEHAHTHTHTFIGWVFCHFAWDQYFFRISH